MTATLKMPKSIAAIEKQRKANGHLVPTPTIAEVWRRHNAKKGWWSARDILVRDFLDMAMLNPPYGTDKDALEDTGTLMQSDKVIFDVATFPVDLTHQAIALLADSHPYLDAIRGTDDHTDKTIEDYEKFAQAVLDQRMQQDNFISASMSYLMYTGWLIYEYPYDPVRKDQGKFPYPLRLRSPLGVYPEFNADKEIIWVSIERKLTGAQLRQEALAPDGKMYPGLVDLIDNEPDDSSLSENARAQRSRPGSSFDTTEFTVIRYYDDTWTALMLYANTISSTASQYNPLMGKVQDKSKGNKPYALLSDAEDEDSEYWGVVEHKMGCIPMTIRGCWPEPRDRTTLDNDALAGKYGWLPFLFAHYTNWQMISAVLSKLHTALLQWAMMKPVVKGKVNLNADVIELEEGSDQDVKFLERPPMTQDVVQYLRELKEEVSKGGIADAGYGARAGTSGSQQNSAMEAGTAKLNVPNGEIERAIAGAITGITHIMIHRGSETLNAVGTGRKYGGKPYYASFSVEPLKDTAPNVICQIKKVNGLKDPTMVAAFKSLYQTLPTTFLLEKLLDEPDGKQLMQQMLEEQAGKSMDVIKPYTSIKAAEAQLATMKQLEELTWKIESLQATLDEKNQMREIEQDVAMLPAEQAKQMAEKTMQDIYQQAGIQPPLMLPPSPGMLPTQPPPNMPPPPGSGGPMPNMPPQSGPPMPPPVTLPPPGMPSMLGNMQGGPMMAPPSILQRPPLLPLGIPPSNMRPPFTTPPMLPPSIPSGGLGQIAKAPGQAQQPLQPLSRFQPEGGVGRPGADSLLVGPGGRPAQPHAMPELAAANAAVKTIGPLPAPTLGNHRNGRTARRKRR